MLGGQPARAFSGWGVGVLAPTKRRSALWSTAGFPPGCCLGFGRPKGSSWPVTISATTALSSDWPAGSERGLMAWLLLILP